MSYAQLSFKNQVGIRDFFMAYFRKKFCAEKHLMKYFRRNFQRSSIKKPMTKLLEKLKINRKNTEKTSFTISCKYFTTKHLLKQIQYEVVKLCFDYLKYREMMMMMIKLLSGAYIWAFKFNCLEKKFKF